MISIQNFIAKDLQEQELVISRKAILDAVKLAGLEPALFSFTKRNKKELVKLGADAHTIKSLLSQHFDKQFFFTLPDSAMALIQNWLGENCQPDLEAYLAKHPEQDVSKLCEYLASLHLYMLQGIEAPDGIVERARCFLACACDEKWHPVLNVVLSLSYKQDDNEELSDLGKYYGYLRQILEAPESVTLSENLKLQFLVVAFCAAIKQRDRKVAAALLEQIQVSDYEQKPYDRMGGKLKQLIEQQFTNSVLDPQMIPVAQTQQFKDTKELEVLTVCTKAPYSNHDQQARYAFSRVIAVRDKDKKWFKLDNADRQRLFPLTGSIVHFEGKNYPPLPKYQSYGVWRVVEQTFSPEQNEKFDTRFFAAQKLLPAHPVLTLEHINSSDKAMAREWIQHTDQLDIESEGERVLRFADGLYVHTTGSYNALRSEGFTQPLRAWQNLPTVSLSSGVQLYIGDLPATTLTYDLNGPVKGLASALRQLPNMSSHENAKYAEVIAEIGANQTLNARLKEIDISDAEWSLSEINKIVELLFATDAMTEALHSKSEQYLSGAHKLFEQANQEHRAYQQSLEDVETVYKEQRQLLDNAQKNLNELFDKRQIEIREKTREIYELQSLLQAQMAKQE